MARDHIYLTAGGVSIMRFATVTMSSFRTRSIFAHTDCGLSRSPYVANYMERVKGGVKWVASILTYV